MLADVTGFGLAGHLFEIIKASNLTAFIELNKIPLLPEQLISREKS